ncbi:MAG: bifunctional heptose 7-phosphate kinase/heptose 1-phosphate adenyltransferase [Desulfuromonas sp.]|uniref:D-glycero-beta-D-manno-heptose-7-phosphate kinase n=1 Tax=Desulfuromonas sp. TaxID=892 RepID=UPI000CCA145A|nr:D-glycero-beta-D-manno-heptose-7-phosphate kinase [Desulfuromonas sp.]PLX84696.1 MAG: bifunctional heptose 7-phosphate kinase/heptose 1-phosphate adenyltransferase [Desulfuromonas sp.]
MNRSEAEKFLSRLGDIRVLVIGDLMLDEYLWGRAERISPEAPVQVVDVSRDEMRLGGAGNVLHNLLALGCQVQLASVVGNDREGELLRDALVAKGISDEGVFREPGRQTTRKTRILAGNQQMLRIDRECRQPIGAAAEDRLFDYISGTAKGCQAILVSDYLKGVLTEGLLARIIALGKEFEIPVVIDPKGDDYAKYRGATLLTPNRKEAERASKVAIVDEESLVQAGRLLRDSLELDSLVLTRSEEGMTLFAAQGGELHLSAEAREVFDVSGAGDTVLALLGAGLAGGLVLEDAAHLANIGAGIVVGKVGTSTVSPQEILLVLGRQHHDSDLKIKDRSILEGLMALEREQGRTIVFTNGCFDLLHAGHVKLLQQSRSFGDVLVLGLNSDASIRRLKGPRRPLIEQDERAHLLAALDCVDYVAIFDEDTPLELIRQLRPHVLVKGGDYAPEQVVGKDVVESCGGRVEIVPLLGGKSTTGLIERIKRDH